MIRNTPHQPRQLDVLAMACAALKISVSNETGDYQLTGSAESGKTIIRVQASSLPRAIRLYREAYHKAESNGLLRLTNVPSGLQL